MTVFVNVLKVFLIDVLNKQIKAAELADAKMSFFVHRNLGLSKEKQVLLGALVRTISNLPVLENDQTIAGQLRNYIEACKTKCNAACEKNHHSPNTTEQTLDILIKFIDTFHIKAASLHFLDIPNEEGAFDQFTHVVISYHARRILDNARSGVVDAFFKNPKISAANAFLQEVEQGVNSLASFAWDNINVPHEPDQSDYLRKKNALGLICLELVELRYEKLLGKYPIASQLVPSYLGELLAAADKTITADKRAKESASLPTSTLTTLGIYVPKPLSEEQPPSVNSNPEEEEPRLPASPV